MAEPLRESPLFARAYDLLRETLADSERMPRSRRAVLGRRMEDAAFGFHEALLDAAKARDGRPFLAAADVALARYRVCLRLAVDLGLFTEGRMTVLMQLVAECGRLLGGWQKKLSTRPQ
jgi:hypothetical protein